jgi:mono/diheme cytochrome c family protein
MPVTRTIAQTTLALCVTCLWVGAMAFEAPQTPPVPSTTPRAVLPQTAASRTATPTPLGALVTTYCVTCHNQRLRTANLALDTADADHVGNSAETWEKVVVKLRSRAMPPAGNRRPDNASYDTAAAWLERELDRAATAHPNPGRPANLHRLNRTEYANAVRDLLGLEIDAPAMLPPDAHAYGFDTNADALSVEPALLDRYLTAATRIARLAVGDPTVRPAFERYTAVKGNSNEQTWLWQTDRLGEDFPLGSRGGIAVRHYFPVDGEYVIKVELLKTYAGVTRGLHLPNEIEIRVDGARVGRFTVGGNAAPDDATAAGDRPGAPPPDADDSLQVRVALEAGLRTVVATAVKSEGVRAEGLGPARIPIWNRESDVPSAPLAISSLLVGGPYNGRVPKDSPSRRRLFVCRPASTTDERACASRILSSLARRAYRRPASDDDVQTLMGFYERARADGDFDNGIRAALERVLVSPDFLFRIEAEPGKVARGSAYRIPDVELASRLSFFLWSSAPDDELLDLAARGKLSDPTALDRQVRRMLADPRAHTALVDNFFGQWLQTRNVWLLTPDVNQRFPWFDDNLRISIVREMDLFLGDQLKSDRSIVDLLTADDTFLNDRLASHYGIPGVYGSHFRRVTLADEKRWGLLGKASVLAVTSYPTRTSPTIRGKWLLENILAAPVPPPPPNVNTTLEESKAGRPASVREMLERHRASPVCASCHARMDPLGFSLENFDAVGQWRGTDGDLPIDASGVLLDGSTVDGPAALRRALVAQKELFVRAVTAKLLTYALGREMEFYDAPAIRAIVRASAASDYRWSATIAALVRSVPFQMRRSRS